MQKDNISIMPRYYNRYIDLVPNVPIVEALHLYGGSYMSENKNKYISLGDMVYEPNKWTIKDILQHIIDTERIFSYRALRFARYDDTSLPGFDENSYALNANASDRTIDDLLLEFAAVRQSTIGLFLGFKEEQFQRNGLASNNDISVLALGFTIVGHVIHHMNILNERYYPLIEK